MGGLQNAQTRLLLRQERATYAKYLHLDVPGSVITGRLGAEYPFSMSYYLS